MLIELIRNPWITFAVVAILTMAEMMLVRIPFTKATAKLFSEKPTLRRGVNAIIGLALCVGIALVQTWGFSDVLKTEMNVILAVASGVAANYIYMIIEKVFGESVANYVGKAIMDLVSHDQGFDGKITKSGAIAIATNIVEKVSAIDDARKEKEKVAVTNITSALSGYMADGVLTDEEKAKAEELIKGKEADLAGNDVYLKFKELLKK